MALDSPLLGAFGANTAASSRLLELAEDGQPSASSASRKLKEVAKTAALTSVTYAPTPFGDRYRQETSVGICASFPAIEFTSDWAPVVRGSHHSGQYFATFADWTSVAVEAPVRISVWRRINSGQSEMFYEYESTVRYAPTGSFTMEGNVKLNRRIGWWGDGPIFAPVDAEPLPYVIDGVEHWAEVPPIQYEFRSMHWVPEPSTLALALIGLEALGLLRNGRQAG